MPEQAQAPSSGNGVFISYSRKDKEFVRRLNDALDAHGVSAWVDWEGIPFSADWMAEVTRAIEAADAFLFVISPDSLASKVCAEELEIALRCDKKLIPILHRMPRREAPMHAKLAATNWVYLRAQDDFDATLPKLIETIHLDLDWIRRHTRLLQRANEWESSGRDQSYLLQGTDLNEAERWLMEAASGKNRVVLPLQSEYIQASRRGAARRQRHLLAGVSFALVVSILLGVYAFFQRNVALEKEDEARANAATAVANANLAATAQAVAEANEITARQNEAQAIANQNTANAQRSAARAQVYQFRPADLYTSTLLALDSWQREPSAQAEDILRQNLSLMPIPLFQMMQGEWINEIAFDLPGTRFVTAGQDGRACVWGLEDGQMRLCVRHADYVTHAFFIGAGEMLVTASLDGRVNLWNAADGTLLRSYEMGAPVNAVAVSPDEGWLAVGRADRLVTVVNLAADRVVAQLEQRGPVSALAFSPDGSLLAIATDAGNVRLWRLMSDFSLSGPQHQAPVYRLAFSPDGEWIVSVGEDSTARLGRLEEGGQRFVLSHGDWVEDVAFGPDSSWFVTVSDDNRVYAWDVATGQERWRARQEGFVQRVVISPNGNWVATTGYDHTVRIWNAASGSEMLRIPLETVGTALAFSPDSRRLVVGTAEGGIGIWDVSSLAARWGYLEFPEFVREAHFGSSGEWLVVNADDRTVRLFPLDRMATSSSGAAGTILFSSPVLTYELTVSPDARRLAVSQGDLNQALLYDIERQTAATLAHESRITDLAFDSASRLLAVGGGERIHLWDAETGEARQTIEMGAPVYALAFHPGGVWLAAGLQNRVVIWDLAHHNQAAAFDLVGSMDELAFSPDGNWMVSSSSEGVVLLWRIRPAMAFQAFSGVLRNGQANAIAFSPDSRLLALGSPEGYVYLYDLTSGEEINRLPHAYAVTGVSFSDDGRLLAAVSRKVVQFWEVDALPVIRSAELEAAACERLTLNFSPAAWTQFFDDEPYHLICPNLPQDAAGTLGP
ncbi:MAG: TIR domain-containing protein [Anaerolineales bacterium]